MRPQPPLWRILRNDNAAFVLGLFGPVLFGYALFVHLSGVVPGSRGRSARPADPEFTALALTVTGLLMTALWALVAVRVARIRRLFADGVEAPATVRTVSWRKGWVRLGLEFEQAGTTCTARATVPRGPVARRLEAGSRVTVLVDPFDPGRAVLPMFYGAATAE